LSRQTVIDALRLSRDPALLRQASQRELIVTPAEIAKGWVNVADTPPSLRVQRASALDLLDNAGRAIGAEPRRRQ
jgi:hypothetical protein